MLPQRITAIALAAAAATLVAVAAILAGDASRADACPTTDPACTRVAGGIPAFRYLPRGHHGAGVRRTSASRVWCIRRECY